MTCHYPDLGKASDWLKQISHVARPIRGKHYPDLGCDTLSVWSLCASFSDVILRPGKPRREMTAVFRLRLSKDYRHIFVNRFLLPFKRATTQLFSEWEWAIGSPPF